MKRTTLTLSLCLTLLASLTYAKVNHNTFKTNQVTSEMIAKLPPITLVAGGDYDRNKLSSPNRYKMAQDGNNVYIAFPHSNCSINGGVPSVMRFQKDTKSLTYLDGVDCIRPTPGASGVPDEYIADDLQVAINPKTKQPIIAFVSRRSNSSLVLFSWDKIITTHVLYRGRVYKILEICLVAIFR